MRKIDWKKMKGRYQAEVMNRAAVGWVKSAERNPAFLFTQLSVIAIWIMACTVLIAKAHSSIKVTAIGMLMAAALAFWLSWLGTILIYFGINLIARALVKRWWRRTTGVKYRHPEFHETLTSLAFVVDAGHHVNASEEARQQFNAARAFALALDDERTGSLGTLKHYVSLAHAHYTLIDRQGDEGKRPN